MIGFGRLSVKGKMTAVAAVFVFGFVAFGIVAYTTLRSVQVGSPMFEQYATLKALVDDSTPSEGSLQPSSVAYFRMFASEGPDELKANIDRFRETVKAFNEKKEFYKPSLPDGELGQYLERGYAYADSFVQLVEGQIIPLLEAGKKTEAAELGREKALPIIDADDRLLDQLNPIADRRAEDSKLESIGIVRWRVAVMAVVFTVSLALAMSLGLLMANEMVARLRGNVHLLGRVAEGDLRERLPVHGNDEICQLAEISNRMIDSLQMIVEAIRAKSHTVTMVSEHLTTTSQSLDTTSSLTTAQAIAVSSAAARVNENTHTVSSASEEMTASIQEISRNAGEAAEVAASASQLAASTHLTMTKLGESSAEIGNVIKVITSIAGQTNLLALNATIEAARAGNAGRGFSVVANEVKELAKETATATEDISRKIAAIQDDARLAVSAIDEITAVIGRINDTQHTIVSSVQEQTAATSEIARNIVETSKGSEEIVNSIESVTHAARETQESAVAAHQFAGELTRLSQDLFQLMERFTLSEHAPESDHTMPVASSQVNARASRQVIRGSGAPRFLPV